MAVKISKVRFMQYGHHAPDGSRFRGVIGTESLIGYSEYMNRSEAKAIDTELGEREDGYFGYTSSHHEGATMSSDGFISTQSERARFRKKLENAFSSKGDIFYENIISLKTFAEAEEYGIHDEKDWNEILVHALPKIFARIGFDESNMIWFADFHINTEHPHIHLVYLEKKHTRDRGKVKQSELDYMKAQIYHEMNKRKARLEGYSQAYIDQFRQKDMQFREILVSVNEQILNHRYRRLNDLLKILPRTGRLQYNSANMKEMRPLIDDFITNTILTDDKTKEAVESLMRTIDQMEGNINGMAHDQIVTLKKAELKKLYERIGNMILKEAKRSRVQESIYVTKDGTERKYRNKLRFTRGTVRRAISSECEREMSKLSSLIESQANKDKREENAAESEWLAQMQREFNMLQ